MSCKKDNFQEEIVETTVTTTTTTKRKPVKGTPFEKKDKDPTFVKNGALKFGVRYEINKYHRRGTYGIRFGGGAPFIYGSLASLEAYLGGFAAGQPHQNNDYSHYTGPCESKTYS